MHKLEATREAHSGHKRVMAYCHDSVGIGHLRRTLNICERVGQRFPQSCFLLATGTPYVQFFSNVPRVDCIKLPALTKTGDGAYESKYLTLSVERLLACRSALLQQAAEHFQPHVLLVDKAPLGVCRELLPTLRWLHRKRPETRIIFGMRDIEDESEATIRQWTSDGVQPVLKECFDEIWVYGLRDVYDVIKEYRLSPAIQRKLRFVGYVNRGVCDHAGPGPGHEGDILVTVGGGTDGEQVLDTYLHRAAGVVAEQGIRSTLVGGPDLPPDVARQLSARASGIRGVKWVDMETCMSCRIRRARLVVSMGGYNTLCEVVAQRRPALVIPRIKPRVEQAIRAELWERRGAVCLLHPSLMTPVSLANRVAVMIEQGPRETRPDLAMDGLDCVADRFEAIWCKEQCDAVAVRV